MDHILKTALCFLFWTAICLANSNFDAINYLEKFGYVDDIAPGQSHDEESTTDGVREFQRFNGLRVTGRLDGDTIKKMKQPRCGLPDVIKPSLRTASTGNRRQVRETKTRRMIRTKAETGLTGRGKRADVSPFAFYAPGNKWEKTDITYKVLSYTRLLAGQDQLTAFNKAFRKWGDVTPLTFRQVTSGNVDIEISFQRGQHSDGPGNAFDGKGGTLAHAYFPGNGPIAGDAHFDDDEEWTLGTDRGTNLEIVAAHEFGHSLGMGHSNRPSALMAPYYQGYNPNYKLEVDDVDGIRSLYGSGSDNGGTQQPPRPTTLPPTPPPNGRYCAVKFDALAQGPDGYTYAVSGDKVYKIGAKGIEKGQNVGDVFQGAPPSPGGAVYDRYKMQLFIFKGQYYWRFTNGFRLDSGYPKTLPEDFRGVRAALQWSDRGIYLFLANDTYVRWVEGLTRASSSAPPRPVNTYFQKLPIKIDAALQSNDGFYYFFKGTRYWKLNARAQLEPGYPKDTRPAWLSCGEFQPR